MAAGHEAHGAEDLENADLGLDVLRDEALGDHVDPGGMSKNVGATSLDKKKKIETPNYYFSISELSSCSN